MNKIIEFFQALGAIIKLIWDKLPKVIKVGSYMALASLIYQLFKDFQVSALINWIPEAYRIIFINWLTVVVVQVVAYFKNKGNE